MSTDGPRLRPAAYRDIAALMYRWTGIRLYGKEHLVEGRLGPRLTRMAIGYTQLIERITSAGPESDDGRQFINSLTTNKTSFFREAHHFDFIRDVVIKAAVQAAAGGGKRMLRLWSAASSSGEEPYSLALVAHSLLPASAGWDVKILATDIDTAVLDLARRGEYDEAAVATVPAALARNAFEPLPGGRVRVRPEIRRLVEFARANLTATPFPVKGKFNAVMCRNVMIYFDKETQERVVRGLVSCTRADGYLIVGHSETLFDPTVTRFGTVQGVHTIAGRPAGPSAATAVSPTTATVRLIAARAPAPIAPRLTRVPPIASPPRRPGPRTQGVPLAKVTEARISITVGEIHASAVPCQISTLLGSCVSACLWDPETRIGGMNHFLLPESDAAGARFGVHAMEILINKLMALGASRRRLVAKAFGAANVSVARLLPVAAQNATFVREYLKREGIPLVSERLGGVAPRSITFDTATGTVWVLPVGKAAAIARGEVAALRTTAVPVTPFVIEDALF